MRLLILIILLHIFCCRLLGQSNNKEKYDAALRYIQNNQRTINYCNLASEYAKSCLDSSSGKEMSFSACNDSIKIKVSNEAINFGLGSCICSYIKNNWKINKNCNEIVGLNHAITRHVRDSISKKYKELKCDSNASFDFSNNEFEPGLYTFFSNICNNHLLSEVIYICGRKDGKMFKHGKAITFYFVFDNEGQIEDVYFGDNHYQ